MNMAVSVTPGKPKKAEKTAISEALRAEIIRLATEGSVDDDGALTPQVLSRLVQVAKTGRDVLVALNVSPTNLAALIKRRRMPWGGMGYDIPDELLGDDAGGDVLGQIGGVLAPSPVGENFGMVALRELIAGMKQVQQSPDRLVEALATARRYGLDDVAKKLEEQLGLSAGAALPPVAKTAEAEIKISFPNGEDGNDFSDNEEGATGETGPTGCPPGEPGDAGPAGANEGGAS